MEKSSKKQINASSTDGSSTKAAAAGTGKQVAVVNAELGKINRTLTQLEIESLICSQQIDDNLNRREDLVQQICLLISALEKTLMFYEQAENARRKLEDALNDICFDIDDVDSESDENQERQEMVDNIHVLQEEVIRAERQVDMIRQMCAHLEPLLKIQKIENERVHAKLCEQLVKIERSRQEAIAKRKQLLKTRSSIKADK